MVINTKTNAYSQCGMGTCRNDLDSVRMMSALRDDLEFKLMNFEIRHNNFEGYDKLAEDTGSHPADSERT
jgi:hypothetical protein